VADPTSRRDVPAEVVARAPTVPGGYVYEIEGEYGPDDAVPPEAVKGAWPVDDEGVPTGEFIPNPKYRQG
jgi:hypothetical protein